MTGVVLTAALYRSILLGLLSGAVATLTARQMEVGGLKMSWEDALISGAIICLTTIITRGLGEGSYDQNRANTNNVNASDVPVAAPGVTVTKP